MGAPPPPETMFMHPHRPVRLFCRQPAMHLRRCNHPLESRSGWQQHVERMEHQMQSSRQALGALKRTLEETRFTFSELRKTQKQLQRKLETVLDTIMARVEILRTDSDTGQLTKYNITVTSSEQRQCRQPQQQQQQVHHHHQLAISPFMKKHLEVFERTGECHGPPTLVCGASRQLATSASQQLNTSAQERGLLDLQTKLAGKVSSILSVFNLRVSRSVGDLRSPGR